MKISTNINEPDAAICHETLRCRELIAAIIERAVRDLSVPQERVSAVNWFLCIDAESCPISFPEACEFIDITPSELVASLRARGLLPDLAKFFNKKRAARGF